MQMIYATETQRTRVRDSSVDPALGELHGFSSTLVILFENVSAPAPGGGSRPAYIAVRPITHQHSLVVIRVHLSQRRGGDLFKTGAF